MKNKKIVCVGGANVDIQSFSLEPVRIHDSNPGHIQFSAGGVGRNIAENLARLGQTVKMVSVTGDDFLGNYVRRVSQEAGVDISNMEILIGHRSSVYVSIMDSDGDMAVAGSDMRIIKQMDKGFIDRHSEVITQADCIITEPNLSSETLDYLTALCRNKPMIADPISTTYAKVLKPFLGRLTAVKANAYEAAILADVPIETEADLEKAADKILASGLFETAITLGAKGVFYKNQEGAVIRETPKPIKMVNATGAGDAFTAGMVFGLVNGLPPKEMIRFSMAASIVALSHQNTINPEMSESSVRKIMESQGWNENI